MIQSFATKGSEDVFNGRNTRSARAVCPQHLWPIATRKIDQLDSVEILDELRIPPGNRLEALRGNLRGHYSIRINQRYWICFQWTESGPSKVDIVDYH